MWSAASSIESASSRIGLKFPSRVVSDSNMCIATLRVEMVDDVIWSRLLILASWPNTKSPPTFGHLNGAANAVPANNVSPVSTPRVLNIPRPIAKPLPSLRPNYRLARTLTDPDGPRQGRAGAFPATPRARDCPSCTLAARAGIVSRIRSGVVLPRMDTIFRGDITTPRGRARAWVDALFIDHAVLR